MATNPGIRLTDIALNPNISKQADLFYTAIPGVSGIYSGYSITTLSLAQGLTANCLSAEFATYQNTYTTVRNNSAGWSASFGSLSTSITNLSSLLQSNSSNWNSTYTTVGSNSSNWQKAYTDLISYNTVISTVSSNTISLCAKYNEINSRLIERFGYPMQVDGGMVMGITKDGRVVGWGQSNYLYDNSNINISPYPLTYIPFFDTDGTDYLLKNPTVTVIDLWYSTINAMALLSNNTVWVNGPTKMSGSTSQAVTANPYTYGFVQVNIPSETPVRISMTGDTNAALSSISYAVITSVSGLWVWGYNTNGQLGLGTTISGYSVPTKVTGSLSNNVRKCVFGGGNNQVAGYAILSDGRLFTAGYNARGQLGLNNTTNALTWSQALSTASAGIGGVLDIANFSWGGNVNSFVIAQSGTTRIPTVWGAGTNTTGQLGAGNRYPVTGSTLFVPITSGSTFTPITGISEIWFSGGLSGTSGGIGTVVCELSNMTGFYVWGSNAYGQCGVTPVPLPFYSNNFVLSTPILSTFAGNISGAKINTTILNALSSATVYQAGNGVLYSAGYNAVNSIAWFPNTNTVSNSFSAMRLSISPLDPVKDWIHINRTSGINAGILALTRGGRVYGIGVDDSNSLNGQSRGSAVLLT